MKKLKFEKQVSSNLEADNFIDEIKENNPELVIAMIVETHYANSDGTFRVTVKGELADPDDIFRGKFIDKFFEKEYFELKELLSIKPLLWWSELHNRDNDTFLQEIKTIYNNLKNEYKEEDFTDLIFYFDTLRFFDIGDSEIEGLNSKSVKRLAKYNNIILKFKEKFNQNQDEIERRIQSAKFSNNR